MLSIALLRSRSASAALLRSSARRQWASPVVAARRPISLSQKLHADIRRPEALVAETTAPVAPQTTPSPASTIPPTGEGVPPPHLPIPPPRTSRFKRLLIWLFALTALGYGGGVYYALVSDNWRDFFTEYIPWGEDLVAFLEEREFQKKIQTSPITKLYPQIRGEEKVAIPGKSGVSSRVVIEDSKSTDLATPGRHSSALDVAAPAPPPPPSPPKELVPASTILPAPPSTPIERLELSVGQHPVVHEIVDSFNQLIESLNADGLSAKYHAALSSAKEKVAKVVQEFTSIQAGAQPVDDEKILALHAEFDSAAQELDRRQRIALEEVDAKWREEWENERERLRKAYDAKVGAELQRAAEVYSQELKNHLLEQAIELYRQFGKDITERVESERDGRLGRLVELENDVLELQRLTGEWNKVVDSNLRTQRLLVAVEGLRAKLDGADRPVPFVDELVVVTEISNEDPVISAAISSMHPSAYQRGISTTPQLIDRFRRVAAEVRKAALLPEDAGVASHIASVALSKVMFRKHGYPVGDDVESILARTELFLEEGNLDMAAREVNGLTGWAKTLSRDWLSECRKVLEVRQALDVISTEARLQSLLVN